MELFPFFLFFSLIAGNHAIGTVRKFPTLPLNANGVWIDPTGGVWRQATDVQSIGTNGMKSEGNISTAAATAQAPQLPLPDYERFATFFMIKNFYPNLLLKNRSENSDTIFGLF
ncbi:hypothetical protein PVAND_006237 [Polypedilum vanderplanki]|uniref:Secreted protein n=1 Tax=Polypedilum vanderplanki TaxID=319348 RepID=A0A9J6C4C7_POLVA|nr:hypothetical protein PVAND_006237 [Polypedilum vanderplanki]